MSVIAFRVSDFVWLPNNGEIGNLLAKIIDYFDIAKTICQSHAKEVIAVLENKCNFAD